MLLRDAIGLEKWCSEQSYLKLGLVLNFDMFMVKIHVKWREDVEHNSYMLLRNVIGLKKWCLELSYRELSLVLNLGML